MNQHNVPFRAGAVALAIAVLTGVGCATSGGTEPAELIAAAKRSPAPPWKAGDELGMANTLSAATTQRCAWHMARPEARVYEASHEFERSQDKDRKGIALIIDLNAVEGFFGGARLQMRV